VKLTFAIAVALLLVLPSAAAAQAPAAAPPPPDVLGELLVEVRGLRQAMERAATVGARIQLLVARVQLQEQRIAELSKRLVAVRDQMSTIDAQSAPLLGQIAMFEKSADANTPDERKELEHMMKALKTQTETFEKRKQDLAIEESQLLQQIAADQGRWSDVSGQLDDLERTLATPAKK
jgi:uncharacterized coiled-coil protein SlyX